MTKDADIQSLLVKAGKNLAAIDQVAAYLLQKRYPLQAALEAYANYLAHRPNSANAAFNYAYYLSRDGQFDRAIEVYQQALSLGIDAPEEVHLNIANIYMDHLRDDGMAKTHLEQSLRIKPDYAKAFYNLGNLSEQSGDRAAAVFYFEQCLKHAPGFESALARLADAQRFERADEPLFARLVGVAQRSNNSDIHFALGRAYEQLNRFDMAWKHFSKANTLDARVFPRYEKKSTEDVFDRIISQCDDPWVNRFGGESDETVFICGMFRTGSTLLEQVLAAHPSFTAGGESQFFPRLVSKALPGFPEGLKNISTESVSTWRAQHRDRVRQLFSGSTRVTEKRPDNFLHVGLIRAVLPSAKFVVTQRDWRDVATSVFTTRLGAGQNYATSLENTRHYIGLQEKLVNHWQSLLGADLKCVRYEDLVKQPETTITDLLETLGEPWDERCLMFNRLKNAVQTASVWQVREPLYTSSVGRWRHYQRFFEQEFGTAPVA